MKREQSRSWRQLIALLLLGGVCVAFGQGRWPIPLLAWFAPILLIAFVRGAPLWFGLVGLTIIHAAGWEVAYLGMVKMPMFARWGLFLGLSLTMALIYQADRWVSRRCSGAWTTLVFPTGWVAFEYLNGRFSPSGSWASIAYTFIDHDSLVQVASLVGWTGLTFLVGWVASVANLAWSERRSERHPWAAGVACAVTIAAVLGFGSLRLWSTPDKPTVRVASVVGPSSFLDEGEFRRDVWAYTRGLELPDEAREAAQRHIMRTIERYIALAERQLEAGAQIVAFPEACCSITKAEEASFVDAARRLASEHRAMIGLGLFVCRPDAGLPAENKFTLIGPDGAIVWDYLKAKLVPGSTHVVGDGTLPLADTEFGRLSCAICFDMDFPVLLQQAGRSRTDILLAPSNDWTEVRATHARMAVLRAIEQGFTMVRPTKDGYSLVTDPFGRTLASLDTDRPGEHVLVADVPLWSVRTLYSVIGDAFSWACMCGFLLSIVVAVRSGRKTSASLRG